MRRIKQWAMTIVLAGLVGGAAMGWQNAKIAAAEEPECRVVVLNIISGPDKLFQLSTAYRVAEDAIASGRHVVLFYNGEGMQVPLKRFSDELRVGNDRSLWRILDELQRKGAEIVVSRESERELGMVDSDFVLGTQVRDWGGAIFEKMPPNTVTFTF